MDLSNAALARRLGPGETARSITYAGRQCRDMCTSPDRPAHESPAKLGTERGTGRKVVYCPCCIKELLPEEDVRDIDLLSSIRQMRPPNLHPGLVAGRYRRFVDVVCLYDVILLWDVKEA